MRSKELKSIPKSFHPNKFVRDLPHRTQLHQQISPSHFMHHDIPHGDPKNMQINQWLHSAGAKIQFLKPQLSKICGNHTS